MAQRFHLGDILTITTGRLLVDMGRVYQILDYLTGDDLMTHQLPAACARMQPVLLGQFPQLAYVHPPDTFTDAGHVKAWLAEQVAEYGEFFDVVAPSSSLWGVHDAVQDLIDIVGENRVVVVELPKEDT